MFLNSKSMAGFHGFGSRILPKADRTSAERIRTNTKKEVRKFLFCEKQKNLPAMLRPPATLRVAMRAGIALQAGTANRHGHLPGAKGALGGILSSPRLV